MTRLFNSNVNILAEWLGNQEYTGRGPARTSRLDTSGNAEADPSSGLPASYIWVRRDGGRAETRALIGSGLRGWERIGNLPVEVGINSSGELEAIKPLINVETAYVYGDELSTAPARNLYIESRQFTAGLVTADTDGDGGLNVRVQPLAHADKVMGGAVSVSASVPSNSGERRLAVIYYDVSADALGVANGAVTTSAAPFTLENAVAIALGGTDRIRLGAVELANGQTTVEANNNFIDCRDWLTLEGTGVQSVVAGTNVTVDNTDPQNPIVSATGGGGGSIGDWIVIREKQTAGTYGGAFTNGADCTRVLNEELVDTGNHASLASNQITLAAGTYRFEIKCPAFFVGQHVAWLYDVTNAVDVAVGTAEYSNPTNGGMNSSVIVGRVTIAGSTVFEVRHRCQTTKTVDGFGTASGFKDEIYTVAMFWKE